MRELRWRPAMAHQINSRIAARLLQMASLLEHQGEAGFRSAAYRHAGLAVERLDRPIDAILSRGGEKALIALPAIGRGIAASVAEMITTGRWQALDRLKGELDPETLLMTIPGVGPKTAKLVYRVLHIQTPEELEQAANDGRLARIGGFGE